MFPQLTEGLNDNCFPERFPYKEEMYAQAIAFAFANTPTGHAILIDLVEDYALTCTNSSTGWEEEFRDACFGLSVQKKLPSAFLVRVMEYRLKNDARESEDVSEWFGVNEVLNM